MFRSASAGINLFQWEVLFALLQENPAQAKIRSKKRRRNRNFDLRPSIAWIITCCDTIWVDTYHGGRSQSLRLTLKQRNWGVRVAKIFAWAWGGIQSARASKFVKQLSCRPITFFCLRLSRWASLTHHHKPLNPTRISVYPFIHSYDAIHHVI